VPIETQLKGVKNLNSAIYTFFVYCRPVNLYVEHLPQLFPVDYLLPRTLLSVMSMEHIEEVYTSMVVPPDACLANAYFFVKAEYYTMEDMVFINYWCIKM